LDSEFVEDALVGRYNSDLANDLGNLWQRSLAMLARFGGGVLPEDSEDVPGRDLAGRLTEEYRVNFQSLAVHKALASAWELVGRLNKLIDVEAPWALAKDPEKKGRLAAVLRSLVEGLALAGALVWPVMPRTGEEIWRRLGLDPGRMGLDLAGLRRDLAPGRPAAAGPALFPRVELGGGPAASKAEKPAPSPPPAEEPPAAEIVTIDEFRRLELRVAEVLAAEAVPKSDKLLKLKVSLGTEERTIVAGMAKHFRPEDMVGRLVVVAANLAPAKLMGITSQGMVLAASRPGPGGEELTLLTPAVPIAPGSRVS
ncbi:MAG: methionine--tRNA ligase subunit beta, partial [Candidatus Adiutrix sp.]|nr:methionine--tRNA ligase subunit beta [Candidatus Adiutrix sp.]